MSKRAEMTPTMKRSLCGAALVAGFVVMASVFSPERTRAGGVNAPDHAPGSHLADGSRREQMGARSLGEIENNRYRVKIHSTTGGVRYTVCDRGSGAILAEGLTAAQVSEMFSDLDLPAIDFSAQPGQGPLMLAEPVDREWR